MTGLRRLLPWRRRIAGKRDSVFTLTVGSSGRPVAVWLAASCVLVVILGVLQFAWIGRVSDSQSAAMRTSLRGGMRLVVAQLHEEMLLLLTTFDPGADVEPARRQELYTQRFRSWRQTAKYGRVVDRLLFFDLRAPKRQALTQLVGSSFKIEPVGWDTDVAPVLRHIAKVGFKPGRTVTRKGLVTWMLYPNPPAVYRPITIPGTAPKELGAVGTVTGYLILQLNSDLIRDLLIPKVLDDHLGELAGAAQYQVTIAVDGEDSLSFESPDRARLERRADGAEDVGYSRRPLSATGASRRPHSSDPVYPFLLSSSDVPQPAARRGAIQQIALRSPVDILRLIGSKRGPPDFDADLALDGASAEDLFHTPLTVSMGLPRLFLVSERPRKLTIRAGPAGTTLEEATASDYRRSVALGMLVLLLLAGSMAMVAVSGIRAARTAEVRMEEVASQSHLLRTPLAAISVLADTLASGKLRPSDEVLKHAGMIRDYGQRLNEIVDSTLQLAAVNSSKSRSNLALLDVSTEAQSALDEAAPVISDAGFTVETALGENLPRVWGDAAALQRSVGELLWNAVKYGLPGRWLKVETCSARSGLKREVQIRIHDRGPGISRKEVRRVFEPYYRAPAIATSAIGGSGLGLTLVLCSVEEMGGKLTFQEGEGGGSVFTIHLPVARSEPTRAAVH